VTQSVRYEQARGCIGRTGRARSRGTPRRAAPWGSASDALARVSAATTGACAALSEARSHPRGRHAPASAPTPNTSTAPAIAPRRPEVRTPAWSGTSTRSGEKRAGRPLRGLSLRPAILSIRNRFAHLYTMRRATPTLRDVAAKLSPLDSRRMIWARTTSRCGAFCRRTTSRSSRLSCEVNLILIDVFTRWLPLWSPTYQIKHSDLCQLRSDHFLPGSCTKGVPTAIAPPESGEILPSLPNTKYRKNFVEDCF
jgi:hypothetical protein